MPYEDPIEAALRALTDVEWRKRKETLEARLNKTDAFDVQALLADHHIPVHVEVSAARSGRYIATIALGETVRILKAVETTGAVAKPHRRKRNN